MATERRQQTLGKDFEREEDPELTEAAENYRAFRDERMALSTKEAESKKTLISMMQTRNKTVYAYDDTTGTERKVEIITKVGAKVAKVKGQSSDDSSGGDSDDNVTVQ